MKGLVLFDIDGTLLDCIHGKDKLTNATKESIISLKNRGYYVMIASGRPYSYLSKEIREFNFDGYILDDGAYTLCRGKEVSHHPIDSKQLKELYKQAKQANRRTILYTKDKAYLYNCDKALLEYIKTFTFQEDTMQYIDNLENIEGVLKLHIQSLNNEDYHNLLVDNKYFYSANDDNHYLKEIYSKQYTKATALLEIIKYLNINIKDTYFFGDGFNDIELMDTVGCAIAMNNASDEVKKHCKYICDSVTNDGVSKFINNSNIF